MSNLDTDREWLGSGSKKPFRCFYLTTVTSFILFSPPEGLAYTSFSTLRSVWWALLFFNFALLFLLYVARSLRGEGKRLDSVILLAVLSFFPIFCFTAMESGSAIQLARKGIFILGPWLYLAVFGDYGFKNLLKAMLIGSILIVVANSISIVLMLPHGSFRPEYGDTWLFGQRTYMRNFIFPCLLFCVLFDRLNRKKISVLTVCAFALAVFSFVAGDSMTSLVVLFLISACLLLSWERLKRIPVFRVFLVASVVVDVLLVHIRAFDLFKNIIENVLHRNMTLSYRTQVWDTVLKRIGENPFTGTGINDLENSGLVVGYGKQLSNAHNQVLDTWYKGGIASLIFFVALVLRCVYPLLKNTHYWGSFVLGVFVGGFFVEAIVSEVWYPQFFLLLYLSAYSRYWVSMFEKNLK